MFQPKKQDRKPKSALDILNADNKKVAPQKMVEQATSPKSALDILVADNEVKKKSGGEDYSASSSTSDGENSDTSTTIPIPQQQQSITESGGVNLSNLFDNTKKALSDAVDVFKPITDVFKNAGDYALIKANKGKYIDVNGQKVFVNERDLNTPDKSPENVVKYYDDLQQRMNNPLLNNTKTRNDDEKFLAISQIKNDYRAKAFSDIDKDESDKILSSLGTPISQKPDANYLQQIKSAASKLEDSLRIKYTKAYGEKDIFDEAKYKNDPQYQDILALNNYADKLNNTLTPEITKNGITLIEEADTGTTFEKFMDFFDSNISANMRGMTKKAAMTNGQELNSDFYTGLESIKNKDKVAYDRVKEQEAKGLPISSSVVSRLKYLGSQILENKRTEDALSGKISIADFYKEKNKIQQERIKNTYENKDILQSTLSAGIAEYLDDKRERTEKSSFLDDAVGAIFGHRYSYSDDEIDEAVPQVAAALGLDVNNPNFKYVVNKIKNSEGIMIGQNGIAKDGALRSLFKGAAQPIRGIANTLEDVVRSDNSIYNESQNEQVAKTAERRVSREMKGGLKTLNDAVEGFGQFVTQAGLTYGGGAIVGGAGSGLLGASEGSSIIGSEVASGLIKSKEALSTLATSYLQSYDSNLKDVMNMTSDDTKAKWGAAVLSTIEGASELILPDVKLGRQIINNFKKESLGAILNVISKEGLQKGLSTGVRDKVEKLVIDGVKKAATNIGQEVLEENITQIANYAVNSILNPQQAADRNLLGELYETTVATAISMSIPALLGVKGVSSNDFRKGALLMASQNIATVNDFINTQVAEGIITEEQANQQISIVKTAAQINDNLPIINGQQLDTTQKENYVFSATREAALKEQINGIKSSTNDEAKIDLLERQVKNEVEYRKGIIGELETKSNPIQQDTTPSNEESIVSENDIVADSAEQPEIVAEEDAPDIQEDIVSVGDMLDKKGNYQGQRGTFVQDGQTVIFKADNSNREYELGNINEIQSAPISDWGIEQEQSVVNLNDDGTIESRGKLYTNPNLETPLKAIRRDKNGTVTGVTLLDPDGNEVTFRGQRADDLAYQLTLKEATKDEESTARFEQFLNTEEADPIFNEGVSATASQVTDEVVEPIREIAERIKIEPNETEANKVSVPEESGSIADAGVNKIEQASGSTKAEAKQEDAVDNLSVDNQQDDSALFDEQQISSEEASQEQMAIKQKALDEEIERIGKEKREKSAPKTNEGLLIQAENEIKNGYDVRRLVDKIVANPSYVRTDLEAAILLKYAANLNAQIEKNPTKENVDEYKRVLDAAHASASEAGRALQAQKLVTEVNDSLANFLVRESEANMGADLTDEQIDRVKKEYKDIEEAKLAFERKLLQLETENAKLKAEAALKKEKSTTKKSDKKTHEDFVKERQDIKKSIQDKLRRLRTGENGLNALPIPFAADLITITPDVLRLTRSLIEEGVTNLADVVSNIHNTLKDSIEGITEKDVHDIIAGEYTQPKKTRNEIAAQVYDLRMQAKLINKLEALMNGVVPKSEKAKAQRSAEIENLQKQISAFQDAQRQAAVSEENIKRLEAELKRVKNRISKDKPTPKEAKQLTEREQELMDDIAAEKKFWANENKKSKEELATESAIRNTEKRIAELEDRITKKDTSKRENKTNVVENDELKKLREKRDELQQQYDAIKKENPIPKTNEELLQAVKTRSKNAIAELERQLQTGDFETKKINEPVKLDKEALDLKDKLIKLRQEREIRILKAQYANRTKLQKTLDAGANLLNVPRSLMSSLDFSAPLRQSAIATVSHPVLAAKAGLEMFKQAFSQKRFDRWFYDLQNDPRYELMQQSGLYVADPHDPRLSVREEQFMSNLAEKIPFVGKLIKGSERAYVSYLNKMRVDIFNRLSDNFEQQGMTFENNPDLYKGLASFVNNSTGRGSIGALESAAPILNAAFFSPRLIASRLNILGLGDAVTFGNGFYGKMPKEIRMQALRDLSIFVGTGITLLSLLALNSHCSGEDDKDCIRVEADPRSSDFGKIQSGNTRWDIWGGFQQYIRVIAQLATGQTKSIGSGKIQELGGEGLFGRTRSDVLFSFIRGKLAPVPSAALNLLSGRTIVGEKATIYDELTSHLVPLVVADLYNVVKENGIKSLFTVGIPSTFGVGTQTYLPKGYDKVDIKDPTYKFLKGKNLNISAPSQGKMTDKEYKEFTPVQQKIFKEQWDEVIKFGVGFNEKGNPTIDDDNAVTIKPIEQLTHDELTKVMKSISNKATRQAKKELDINIDEND